MVVGFWDYEEGGVRGDDNLDYITTLANDDEAMCRRVEELEAALRDASSKLLKQSLRANAYEETLRDIAGRQNGPGRALVLLARAALDGERP